LLSVLRPDRVHILVRGSIVESGGPELADRMEAEGYAGFTDESEEAGDQGRAAVRPGSLDELFASG
jgi:Fe-S cluster assembly ATP-binding protein